MSTPKATATSGSDHAVDHAHIRKSRVLEKHLDGLQGHEVIVVMQDDRSYKGRLVEFDSEWLVMNDVTEGTAQNLRGWEEATVSMGLVEKYITMRGIISEERDKTKIIRLKEVLINLDRALRIWPLRPEYLAKPEHIHLESTRGASRRT